jgi:hypothetical protein
MPNYGLRSQISAGFELVEGRFKQLKHELVAQLGTIAVGAVALLGAVTTLLK